MHLGTNLSMLTIVNHQRRSSKLRESRAQANPFFQASFFPSITAFQSSLLSKILRTAESSIVSPAIFPSRNERQFSNFLSIVRNPQTRSFSLLQGSDGLVLRPSSSLTQSASPARDWLWKLKKTKQNQSTK